MLERVRQEGEGRGSSVHSVHALPHQQAKGGAPELTRCLHSGQMRLWCDSHLQAAQRWKQQRVHASPLCEKSGWARQDATAAGSLTAAAIQSSMAGLRMSAQHGGMPEQGRAGRGRAAAAHRSMHEWQNVCMHVVTTAFSDSSTMSTRLWAGKPWAKHTGEATQQAPCRPAGYRRCRNRGVPQGLPSASAHQMGHVGCSSASSTSLAHLSCCSSKPV